MSERRKAGVTNRTVAYIAAGVVHVLIIGVLLFNFTSKKTETVEGFDAEKIDTVKASLINESDIKDQQDKLKKLEAERKRKKREKEQREKDRLEKLKRDAEKEKEEIKKLKKQQKEEIDKAAELQKQREAIALEKKKEEDQRKIDKAAREKKEREEKKRKEKIAKQKAEKEARKKREQDEADRRERERLSDLLKREEAAAADRIAKVRTTTVISKFFNGIQRKIELKRNVDPRFETWRTSTVDIKLSPSGEVLSVRTIESSGSALYDQSVENAVYAASPFELPDQAQEPDAVRRLQNFELEVKHPSARR